MEGVVTSAHAAVRLLLMGDVDAPTAEALAGLDIQRVTERPDLILADLASGGWLQARQRFPGVPVLVLADDDADTGLDAVRRGAVDYLVKGRFGPEQLAAAIRHAVERATFEAAPAEPRADLITGGPEAIRALLDADPTRPAMIVAVDRNPTEMKRVLDLDSRPGPVRFIDATGSGGHSTGEILVVSPVRLEAIAMRMERIADGLGPDTLCIICSLDGLAMYSSHDVVLEFSHYITHRFRTLGRDLAIRARPGSRFIGATKGLLACP